MYTQRTTQHQSVQTFSKQKHSGCYIINQNTHRPRNGVFYLVFTRNHNNVKRKERGWCRRGGTVQNGDERAMLHESEKARSKTVAMYLYFVADCISTVLLPVFVLSFSCTPRSSFSAAASTPSPASLFFFFHEGDRRVRHLHVFNA